MNALAIGDIVPDLVLLLDVADDVAESRRDGGTDRLEAEGAEFHARVRAAYRVLAAERGWVVVGANGPVAEVERAVRDAVAPLLAG
jgi:dTMP kinase